MDWREEGPGFTRLPLRLWAAQPLVQVSWRSMKQTFKVGSGRHDGVNRQITSATNRLEMSSAKVTVLFVIIAFKSSSTWYPNVITSTSVLYMFNTNESLAHCVITAYNTFLINHHGRPCCPHIAYDLLPKSHSESVFNHISTFLVHSPKQKLFFATVLLDAILEKQQ